MDDELTLLIDNKEIKGWDDIRVTRGIERFPSDFVLSLMDYYPGTNSAQVVNPGHECVVKLGNDVVLTGYIDRWAPSITKQSHIIRAMGRGKCQDLVDCSAEWSNNLISASNALQIAKKLAKPYGISVSSDGSSMKSIPTFMINWGETSQDIIERIAKWSALLYYDLPDGSLYFSRVGDKVAASGVEQGANIQSVDYIASMDDRFSTYTGVQLSSVIVEVSNSSGNSASQPTAPASTGKFAISTVTDPEASKMRYRNRIITVESNMIASGLAKDCISWEMNRRYGRSKVLRVIVDSWRDVSGKLWEPNTLIPIKIPAIGLDDEIWLLSEVSYLRNQEGTRAELILMPPEAFIVEPYTFYSNTYIKEASSS